MGISGHFPVLKRPERDAYRLSRLVKSLKYMEIYFHPILRLHGVVFNQARE
jgi:hypothetical protein